MFNDMDKIVDKFFKDADEFIVTLEELQEDHVQGEVDQDLLADEEEMTSWN